jgi:hypothetical protein
MALSRALGVVVVVYSQPIFPYTVPSCNEEKGPVLLHFARGPGFFLQETDSIATVANEYTESNAGSKDYEIQF